MFVDDVLLVVGGFLKGSWFGFACTGPFCVSAKGLWHGHRAGMGGGDVMLHVFLVFWWWQSTFEIHNSYLAPRNSCVVAEGAVAGAQGRRG